MKTSFIKVLIPIVLLIFTANSCTKNNIVGGDLHKPTLGMSTYDFLVSNPYGLFDTVKQIIDSARLKDLINGQDITFFCPTDYNVKSFLDQKRAQQRAIDERLDYTLDSLFKYCSRDMLRDSMGLYIFAQPLSRDNLTAEGDYYPSITANNDPATNIDHPWMERYLSLEEVENYTISGLISSKPKCIFYTKIIGLKDNDEGKDPSGDEKRQDVRVIVQTSGLISTNGIIHVLDNSHTWLFFKYPN
jgi:hypothetical protein